MAYTSPPKTWVAADVLTAAQLNTYLRDMIEALFPVGSYLHICQAATSVETLVNGVWLECNGAAVSRTTYSALNTLMSGLSYPYGVGNGTTTFNVPDLRGRTMVHHSTASGNASTNTMGFTDAAALASRTTKPSVSISGTTGAHTHAAGSYAVTLPGNGNAVGGTTSPLSGSASVTGTSGSSTASFSGSGTATTAYAVTGIYVIKAFL